MTTNCDPEGRIFLYHPHTLCYSDTIKAGFLMTYSKTGVNSHSKIDKTKILITFGSLMKVESIAECSHSAIILTCIKQ